MIHTNTGKVEIPLFSEIEIQNFCFIPIIKHHFPDFEQNTIDFESKTSRMSDIILMLGDTAIKVEERYIEFQNIGGKYYSGTLNWRRYMYRTWVYEFPDTVTRTIDIHDSLKTHDIRKKIR